MSEEEKAKAQQAPEAPAPAEDVAAPARKPKKWPIVISILAIFLAVFFVAFLHWHEEPTFCNAFCHQPMDKYVEGYYSGDDSMLVTAHAENGVTCLSCHWPQAKMLDLVHEVVYWTTDRFTDPLPAHQYAVGEQSAFVSDEFCGRCHDGVTAPKKESATANMFGEYDPHNIPTNIAEHMTAGKDGGAIQCGDCHTVHKGQTMICAECHDDVFNESTVPDGWTIPSDIKDAYTADMGAFDPHNYPTSVSMHMTGGSDGGAIACSDCHKPEGQQNVMYCAKCHSDVFTEDSGLVPDGWTLPDDAKAQVAETFGVKDMHSLITLDAFKNVSYHQTAGADGGMITCTDCHKDAGEQNVFICAECHASDYEGLVPDGWTTPESLIDIPMMGGSESTTESADSSSADSSASSDAVDLSKVPDGTYHGEAQGMESTISVDVTVAGGKITDVQATGQETEGIGSVALEEVPSAIVSAGTTEGVDGHAGASVTSKAIFDAVNSALASATA